MGLALPSAIGACLASGRRRTICVDGDGSLQMNIQELETIARLGLPLKIIVLNNAGYASIRTSQKRHFQKMIGADAASGMTLPDMLAVARAFRIPARRILDRASWKNSWPRALASPGPELCDVMIPPDELYEPCVSSVQTKSGSMVSRPLEDLYPFLAREEHRANMIVPAIEEES